MKRYLLLSSVIMMIAVLVISCDLSTTTPVAAPPAVPAEGFLRVQGQQIVDSSGDPVYLRGINMDTFYHSYGWNPEVTHTYGTQDDIELLAEMGANVIRLGFHWRYFEDGVGFALIDQYLDWCRSHNVYIVLDMHVVPGDEDILDGFIWDDPAAQQHFVELWTEIAQRYHAEPVIAGYDIYNEPDPDGPSQWWVLAQQTVDAIRSVDGDHIIFVEEPMSGGFELLNGSNLVYSFHNYMPFGVTHAGADWVGDTPVPVVSIYPGPGIKSIEWVDVAAGTVLEEDTSGWVYFDSGLLSAPPSADWISANAFAWGDVGRVWFDDLEVWVDGEPWPLLNPGAEQEGWLHGGGYPSSWDFYAEGSYTSEWSSEAHSGSRSLMIEGNGDYANWGQDNWILTEPLIPSNAGTEFSIRGWVRGENHGPEWGGYGLSLHGFRNVWADYDYSTLEASIQPCLEWAQANDVPLWVGEFGSMRYAPDDSGYRVIEDMIAIMNEHELGWTMWSYRENTPQDFGLYHGPVEGTTAGCQLNQPLADILRVGWLHGSDQ